MREGREGYKQYKQLGGTGVREGGCEGHGRKGEERIA